MKRFFSSRWRANWQTDTTYTTVSCGVNLTNFSRNFIGKAVFVSGKATLELSVRDSTKEVLVSCRFAVRCRRVPWVVLLDVAVVVCVIHSAHVLKRLANLHQLADFFGTATTAHCEYRHQDDNRYTQVRCQIRD